MRVPGLVARLMGLDSMPSQRGNTKKLPAPDSKKTDKFPRSSDGGGGGRFRLEIRPRKLQKTNVSEKEQQQQLVVDGFRNVLLSQSRKQQLPSPLRSPRIHPRKTPSRLIGAATKILEPGLLQRSKLKCAITYSNNLFAPSSNDAFVEENLSSPSTPLTSCRNCGYFQDDPVAAPYPFAGNADRFGGRIQKCKLPMGVVPVCVDRKRRSSGIAAAPPQIPIRLDNDKFQFEKKRTASVSNASSLPPVGRKRRSANSDTSDFSTLNRENMNSSSPEVVMNTGRKLDHNYHYQAMKSQCRGGDGSVHDSLMKYATSAESCRKKRIVRPISISGDKLGAILEQKLKDLKSQGEEEFGPKKSAAAILEELIVALTSEKLSMDHLSHDEHSSPGSTLEAYFSAESCLSSSVDDNNNTDLELSDSAASWEKKKFPSKELITKFLRNVSETLYHPALAGLVMDGSKHEEAKTVLLNAELFLHSSSSSSSSSGSLSLIKNLLETVADLLSTKLGGTHDGGKLKRFALDATLEYLNSRFESERMAKKKFPTLDMLIFEIADAVRRWNEGSELGFDELIDREMSFDFKEWTMNSAEIHECGLDISRGLLDDLVDEVVKGILL
ncbi:hypothetical protein M569_08964 [Genlisea aurea]|uniref:DUF4378 domain-containing protein n=1 Tax=Genlisea aurea TaxID=192259 RepID=S8DRT1_9LAMI|nr:hypothetical protein M569_08964 [Genlisea aurea]